MLPIEGDRWIVGLGGTHGASAPGDWDGFLRYAQQLRTPTVYEAIKHSTPPERLPQFGFPESVWRHFERLTDLPTGLLPLGDTARDPAVHKLTLEVQHLFKPRSALLTPDLVERVHTEMVALS